MGKFTPKGQGNLNTVLGAVGTLGTLTDPDGILGGVLGGRRGYRGGYDGYEGYGERHEGGHKSKDCDGLLGGIVGGILANYGGRGGYRGYDGYDGFEGGRRGVRDCDCHVTEKEFCLGQQLSCKDDIIAKLEAEKYTDNKLAILTDKFENKVDKLNEKFENKFDWLAAKECDLEGDLKMETERRVCGDENIVSYVNGNFVKNTKVVNGNDVWYNACKPELVKCDPCCNRDND